MAASHASYSARGTAHDRERHPGVVDAAELGALAAVRARLVDREREHVLATRDRVRLNRNCGTKNAWTTSLPVSVTCTFSPTGTYQLRARLADALDHDALAGYSNRQPQRNAVTRPRRGRSPASASLDALEHDHGQDEQDDDGEHRDDRPHRLEAEVAVDLRRQRVVAAPPR